MKWTILIVFGLGLLTLAAYPSVVKEEVSSFNTNRKVMRGLSFVAPPKPFPSDPMPAVKEVGADWIAVIPYGFSRLNQPTVRYNVQQWQWWGELPEGCKETIRTAQASNINVMLKPQVYIPGSWPGGLNFKKETDWQQWEASYEDFILSFAQIAEEKQVPLFCIGTEFKVSSINRPQFWRQLIQKVRKVYTGKLTYAANWDEYKDITFWDELDYIGVDAYFPLVKASTPSVKSIVKAWDKPKAEMKQVAKKFKKPVLFTEFGYLSVDGCTYNNWELEPKVKSLPINEQAQANALEAVFQSFWNEDFWHGGFIWKWFPNGEGHEGYVDRDYTPQGKEAEKVVKEWYFEE